MATFYVIYKWEHCVNGEMKPNSQPVDETNKLSTSYFFLSFKGKLPLGPLVMRWKCLHQRSLWQNHLEPLWTSRLVLFRNRAAVWRVKQYSFLWTSTEHCHHSLRSLSIYGIRPCVEHWGLQKWALSEGKSHPPTHMCTAERTQPPLSPWYLLKPCSLGKDDCCYFVDE